jgi:hypothetical protein
MMPPFTQQLVMGCCTATAVRYQHSIAHILLADALSAHCATDWNLEAGEMVEEVIKTQKQVAELLSSHRQATSELEALKETCTQEVSRVLYSCVLAAAGCKPRTWCVSRFGLHHMLTADALSAAQTEHHERRAPVEPAIHQ